MDFSQIIRFQLSDTNVPGILHTHLLEDIVHHPSSDTNSPLSTHLHHRLRSPIHPPLLRSILHPRLLAVLPHRPLLHLALTPALPIRHASPRNLHLRCIMSPSLHTAPLSPPLAAPPPSPNFHKHNPPLPQRPPARPLTYLHTAPSIPPPQTITQIFALTPPHDPLRSILADAFIAKGVTDLRSSNNLELLREVNAGLMRRETRMGWFVARVRRIVGETGRVWEEEGRRYSRGVLEVGMVRVMGLVFGEGMGEGV